MPQNVSQVSRPRVDSRTTREGLSAETIKQISTADRGALEIKRQAELAAAERGRASLRAEQERGRQMVASKNRAVVPEDLNESQRIAKERMLLVNERVAMQSQLEETSWLFFWKKPAMRQKIA